MPHCENCNYKWTLIDTTKAHFDYNKGTTCPNCRKAQYVSRQTKILKGFVLLGYIAITFLAWRVFNFETIPFFSIAILTVLVGVFILIASTKLSNTPESVR